MAIDSISGPFCTQLVQRMSLGLEGGGSMLTEDGQQILGEDDLSDVDCEGIETVKNCPPDYIRFVNQERTEIEYNDLMRGLHGNTPMVLVYYFDPIDGGLLFTQQASRMSMQGSPPTRIIIDHGGEQTGYIKIM